MGLSPTAENVADAREMLRPAILETAIAIGGRHPTPSACWSSSRASRSTRISAAAAWPERFEDFENDESLEKDVASLRAAAEPILECGRDFEDGSACGDPDALAPEHAGFVEERRSLFAAAWRMAAVCEAVASSARPGARSGTGCGSCC
jgi:hypothetical protein